MSGDCLLLARDPSFTLGLRSARRANKSRFCSHGDLPLKSSEHPCFLSLVHKRMCHDEALEKRLERPCQEVGTGRELPLPLAGTEDLSVGPFGSRVFEGSSEKSQSWEEDIWGWSAWHTALCSPTPIWSHLPSLLQGNTVS
jgi:hypothetical protein